jgi:methyl-accepting chemotaxis protein
MRFKDLRIGTKLYSGFIIVLLLTLLVGVFAFRGISRIVYQLEIAKNVNRIIVDAGDAQGSSLRYIIYGDDAYYKEVSEETNNINELSEQTKTLLLSAKNKENIVELEQANDSYLTDNQDYYNLEQKKKEAQKIRSQAALEATSAIIKVEDIIVDYYKSHRDDYSVIDQLIAVQETRNSINRVRIAANKYVADASTEREKAVADEVNHLKSHLAEVKKLVNLNTVKMAIEQSEKAINDYEIQFIAYRDIVQEQQEIMKSQKESSNSLLQIARNLRQGVYEYIDKTQTNSYTLLITFVVIALILGLFIGTIITRGITIPLAKGVNFADVIANGDLTKELEIDQKDEVGMLSASLGNMATKLKEVVTGIISGSDSIASASQQLSSTSQELSQGSNEQASSVEEVSSTMEEIASNIEQNTDNAKQTESISKEANKQMGEVLERSQKAVQANK